MFTSLINLFFPITCSGCDAFLLSFEKVICTSCRHKIPLTNHHLLKENEAFKKFYGKITIEFAVTMMYYHKKGIVQEIIHNLKYKGQEEIGTVIGDWYADELKSLEIMSTIDCIIPVPLHKKKLKERGYNQVTSFGVSLSKHFGVCYNNKLLFRYIYSKTQTKKNLLSRTELNIKPVFDVVFSEKDYNKHYLLIDDVLTTGSTIEACGKALLKIPGAKLSVICMAMSHS